MPFDKVAYQKAYYQKRRLDPEFWARNAERRSRQKAYDQKRRLDPEVRARNVKMTQLWHKRNPGRQKANDQKRYQDPEIRARKAETTRLWNERNPGYLAGYRARRRKNDPAYRILHNCRNRVRHALRGRGAKSALTLELLGCTAQQLKLHLEAQFKPEMTWENYGTHWQIDHIFPCAKFDLSCPKQQRQCFHFSNLQPLEARENLLKKDHYARYR